MPPSKRRVATRSVAWRGGEVGTVADAVIVCGEVPSADGAWTRYVALLTSFGTPTVLREISNQRVVHIAASAASRHALFVTDVGEVYAYGDNAHGQTGAPAAHAVLAEPLRLELQRDFLPPLAEGERIVGGAAGTTHSMLVTSQGTVYAAGSNRHGQVRKRADAVWSRLRTRVHVVPARRPSVARGRCSGPRRVWTSRKFHPYAAWQRYARRLTSVRHGLLPVRSAGHRRARSTPCIRVRGNLPLPDHPTPACSREDHAD